VGSEYGGGWEGFSKYNKNVKWGSGDEMEWMHFDGLVDVIGGATKFDWFANLVWKFWFWFDFILPWFY